MTNSSAAGPQEITMLAVRQIVANCLGVDVEKVTPSSKFVADLGCESMDDMDLAFSFEKAFHIKAPFETLYKQELWQRDRSGQPTPTALQLHRDTPYLPLDQFSKARNPWEMLTVELMYELLQHFAKKESCRTGIRARPFV